MSGWEYPALAALGAFAGFVNVLAGGGSLLTMPAMIFLGMPPAAANGTNRVALLAQNVVSVSEFARRGFSDLRLSLTLGLATVPGAVAGAVLAVEIDPVWFQRILGVVMVVVLVVILRRRPADDVDPDRHHPVAAHLGMVAVGLYGGFVQAGVGFVVMALLRGALGLDLVRINMHKVFVIGLYTIPALAVFAWNGQVWWLAGGCLALGNMTGAWIGTSVSVTRGEGVIKVVFAVAVIAMALRLLLA